MRVTQSLGLPRGFRLADDPDAPAALRPLGLAGGAAARALVDSGQGAFLAGGPLAFTAVEALLPDRDGGLVTAVASLSMLDRWAGEGGEALSARMAALRHRITAPRTPIAGIALDRPRIAGIVNVTPDSFSDGGAFATTAEAIAHGRALAAAGADIIDVGGESTRPGSAPVPEDAELDRVVPVIAALADDGLVVSVDTRRPSVMRAAIAAGARVVNDVTALAAPGAVAAVAETGAAAVLMHMQGDPASMQQAPRYDHAPWEVYRYLHDRVAACAAAGIGPERLAVDPGIGFGKDHGHNLVLLDAIALFHGTGCAVMAGVSRKSFIGRIDGDAPPLARLAGTIAATVHAVGQGVQLHRVHDVADARQALAVWHAVAAAG